MQHDHFFPLTPEALLSWILADLKQGEALGIVEELFFIPQPDDPFQLRYQGRLLETPLGVAAGPQTQMAQNIVAAWLCGARWIELKTVQTLDELTITRPCIAAANEGYNCEWSQELKLDESFEQYLLAHVLLHLLRHRLSFVGNESGFAATMSVGYDFAGIQTPSMQRFLNRMTDCHSELSALRERLTPLYPALAKLEIAPKLAESLTLSTMHGCPPEEIERIGRYFLEERRLSTAIKLNPTLLGPERVRMIINDTLGFDVEIPDVAFSHDLGMPQAIELIRSLQDAAARADTYFTLKLTNTLETVNRGSGLPLSENMVYLSGRPLHPVAVELADTLQAACGGKLNISFCAGVDFSNVVDVLASGLAPVTVCTDLLKPGGYGRLRQYVTVLKEAMIASKATNLSDLALARATKASGSELPVNAWAATLANLHHYAVTVVTDQRYSKGAAPNNGRGVAKYLRTLPRYDCAVAPCRLACQAEQDVPRYLDFMARNRPDLALATILATNPLPSVLGLICDRQCHKYCVRGYYDTSVAIRNIKGCAAQAGGPRPTRPESIAAKFRSVTVLGAGLVGLSCAWYLAQAGFHVALHETNDFPGGQLNSSLTVLRDDNGQPVLDREVVAAAFANQHGKREAALAAATDLAALMALPVTFYIEPPSAKTVDIEARPDTMVGPGALPAAVGRGRHLAATWLERLGKVGQLPIGPNDDRPRDVAAMTQLARCKAQRSTLTLSAKQLDVCIPETVTAEARRCLQCDLVCNLCVTVCPNRANFALSATPRRLPLQRASRDSSRLDAQIRVETMGYWNLVNPYQVINLADLCNACGNCVTFCPSNGMPFRDKPRWHLSRESFVANGEGYFLAAPDRLEALHHGQVATLTTIDGHWRYTSATITAELNPLTFEALIVQLSPDVAEANLFNAVELALLYSLTNDRPPFTVAASTK